MKRKPLLPSALLQKMRLETDPEADKVVTDLLDRNPGGLHELFEHLTRNRDIDKSKLPPEALAFFEKFEVLPDWVDHDKLHIGQDVFRRFGIEASMLLFYLAMPCSYMCWRGARVLTSTGRLTVRDGNVHRFAYRLMETAQFVLDVMAPGAFHPEGRGVSTTLKVRLIHASIRHFITTMSKWDEATLGKPLNQEDEAGTLMCFSAMTLYGLKNAGVQLTEEEQDGYFHCWQVVGHLLGIRPELIPANYADGVALGFQIFDEQKGPSEASDDLIDALIDFVQTLLPKHWMGRYFPIMMMQYFLEENVGATLKFRKISRFRKWLFDILMHLMSFFLTLFRRPRHHLVAGHLGRTRNHFLQHMILYFNDHKQVRFDIPPSLKGDWENPSST